MRLEEKHNASDDFEAFLGSGLLLQLHEDVVILGRGCGTRLLSRLPDVDAFCWLLHSLSSPSVAWFRMLKDGVRPLDSSVLNQDGWLNVPALIKLYNEGHSLLQTHVQRRHVGVAAVCNEVEEQAEKAGYCLKAHVGGNLYWSPPGGRGLGIHYDAHDVIVVQLGGSKRWRLFNTDFLGAVRGPERYLTEAEAGGEADTFTLRPGDVALLPKGATHEAVAGEEGSLHLTMNVAKLTSRDILTDVVLRHDGLGAAVRTASLVDGLPCEIVNFFRNGDHEAAVSQSLRRFARSLSETRDQRWME